MAAALLQEQSSWRWAWIRRYCLRRRGLPPPHISYVARAAPASTMDSASSDSNCANPVLQTLVGGVPICAHVHRRHSFHALRFAFRDGFCSLRHRRPRPRLAQV